MIERNFCEWPQTGPTFDNEVAMISGASGATTAITFRNNEFVQMRQGINLNGASGIAVLNNTFSGILQEAVIPVQTPAVQITNNIFYNVGSGDDSYVCADTTSQATLQVASNDHFMQGGAAPGTYCGNAPHLTLDPLFTNAAANDFHLQSNSPMIDQGTTLTQVTNDYYATPRPQGAGYDIGAVEYHSSDRTH